MATPFDHLDSFKALAPDIQTKIVERFGKLPEPDQLKIMNKIGTPMSAQAREGVQPTLLPLAKTEFEETGPEDIATGLTPHVGPHLAALAGTTFRLIPEIAMAAPAFKGAKAGVSGVKEAGKAIAESSVGKAIRGTGAAEVAALTEKAAELPLKQTAKQTLVQSMKKEAGAAMGAAEKEINIGISKTSSNLIRTITSNPDKLTKFADRAAQLAEKGADKLAETASPETLQFYRKTAQQGLKSGKALGDIARSKLYQVNQVFGEALGKTNKPFGEALSRYKEIEAVIKALPAEAKREKQILQVALVKARNVAAKQSTIRKTLGAGVIAAAAGGFGAKLGRKVAE